MKAFTKTKDWPNRRYHATCYRKRRQRIENRDEESISHAIQAEVFWKVEAIDAKDRSRVGYRIVYATPLWKAQILIFDDDDD
jgi:hypothetical protein